MRVELNSASQATGPTQAPRDNAPGKAKALKIDMVRAYNVCGASNDTQGNNPPLPACHPPVATTTTSGTHNLSFGIKGAANVQVGVKTGEKVKVAYQKTGKKLQAEMVTIVR